MSDRTDRPIRVLQIEDHRLFSEVIASTLEGLGLQVLGTATTAREGLEIARRERPDLVLVDLMLPDDNGLTLGRKILKELPDAMIVAVTSVSDVRTARAALRAGFRGFITKDIPLNRFASSIQAILDGQVLVPRTLARAAAGMLSADEQHAAMLIRQLTQREREVLDLLAQGTSNSDIAKKLSVSANTIRSHVQNILSKLQVHSRLEAAAFAVRHGLFKPDIGGDG